MKHLFSFPVSRRLTSICLTRAPPVYSPVRFGEYYAFAHGLKIGARAYEKLPAFSRPRRVPRVSPARQAPGGE
ncbi:MAG: hypothetical protein A3H35_02590 [Betaproteobacteria bacterium RIFCSPLOWO2_02_FULL_62_17]|nr:MAG: hypothetical protein A3H35_02590 [Betaproteobacteria bacterium RIFCSPLOWO2_02_FULL_62_17]